MFRGRKFRDYIKICDSIAAKIRRMWMRFGLRGVHYRSQYGKLNWIYMMPDPWNAASPSQKFRFEETNRLIEMKFGRVNNLLEIGCGEGHQSLYLNAICDHLTGLDVSLRVVKRAAKRCPQSDFFVGDIFSKECRRGAPYDLVVACECLYYMKEIPDVISRMRELGRNTLVSYFSGRMDELDPQILSVPEAMSEILEFEGARWRIVWWRN